MLSTISWLAPVPHHAGFLLQLSHPRQVEPLHDQTRSFVLLDMVPGRLKVRTHM
jgi:hypothetical protein